jgi:hypothetical protein
MAEGLRKPDATPEGVKTDSQEIACDFVHECAGLLLCVSMHLLAAASAGDLAGVEARIWQVRRIFRDMATTWREAVPRGDDNGGAP